VWFAQGLRGIAAMLVVVDHLFLLFWISNQTAASYTYTQPVHTINATEYQVAVIFNDLKLSLGMLGVAIFFLISGFVIPMSLERLRPGRFLVARAFRIYPTYIVGLAIVALFVTAAAGAFPWSGNQVFANATLLRDFSWSTFIAPVSWSLEVEIKFYVLCALIVWLSSLRSSRALVAVCGGLCGLAAVAAQWGDDLAAANVHVGQVASVFRDDARYLVFMFVGVCFYNLFRRHWSRRRFAATAGILLGLHVVALGISANGWWFSISPAVADWWKNYLTGYGIALVIFGGCYLARAYLPRARPLDFLANVSYPLYIVHQIVGFVLLEVFYQLHPVPVLNACEALACVLVIAYAMHRFVELPSNVLGKRVAAWRRRPVLAPAVVPVPEAPPP
jgi:peptidoglycan/LPS O-acetylase OafA/YrhL